MKKQRILFLGTPAFAAVALQTLASSPDYEVIAAICQPDKPAGRGNKLKAPEVKVIAQNLSIKVLQPETLKGLLLKGDTLGNKILTGDTKTAEIAAQIGALGQVDAIVCVAYGKIVPKALLDYPRVAAINIHPSLLPRWRGAAPIEWALFSGDKKTGVCLMQMDEGLDSGPVYKMQEEEIASSDNFVSLETRLANIGAKMLLDNLAQILSGTLIAKSQVNEGASYAEKWENENYQINWHEDAGTCLRRIKTCAPDGARASFRNELVKIHEATVVNENYGKVSPGTIVHLNKVELIVAVGSNQFICLQEMQFPGKKRLAIRDVLAGKKFEMGERFS